jgi:hypothetical protein
MLGRSETCQLTISDESVSKHHACLIRISSGLWVVDLLSREGIFVNDVKVRWAWLEPGDLVKIGRLSFKVWYDRRPEGIRRDTVPITAGVAPPSAPEDHAGPHPPTSSRLVPSQAAQPLAAPSVPMLVSAPGQTALPDQLVLPEKLVWQPPGHFQPGLLAVWQHQIQVMESFHRDMIFMVRMFFAMHQEQQASVREELSKVEQLTQELKGLQSKLAEVSRSEGNGRDANRNASAPGHSSRQEVTCAAASRADSVNSPGLSGDKMGQPDIGSDQTSAPSAAASLHEVPAATGPEDRSVSIQDAELHQTLTNRINDLQRERRRYWQQILNTIRN